jgi:hypothetical protein
MSAGMYTDYNMKKFSIPVVAASSLVFIAAGCAPSTAQPTASSPWNPDIDPADFSATIDNPLYPLPVDATWTYTSETDEGTETVVVTVLPETKMVMGVETRIVHDQATIDGVLSEDTYDWYAQKSDGSVWYFGEDTVKYEEGKAPDKEGSWEFGKKGAKPGVMMLAAPKVDDSYYEEYLAGEAEDQGRIVSLSQSAEVPYGAFSGCLEILDYTDLDPSVQEYKYYCRDIGLVLTVEGDVREDLAKFEK